METKEIELRIKTITEQMEREQVEGSLISSNTNLLYTSGVLFNGYTYITQDGKVFHFVRRPNNLKIDNLYYIRKPEQIPDILREEGTPLPNVLWMEGDEMTHAEWGRMEKIFPSVQLINSTHILRQVRAVKTPYEQQLVREGGRKQSAAFKIFPSLYKPGMTDQQYSIEMEYEIRKMGSLGIVRVFGQSMEAFMGTVLVGDNASAPSVYDFALGGEGLDPSIPIGQSGTLIKSPQTIMVDICGNFNGYHVDQTRIFSLGKTTKEAYDAHRVSEEIHEMFRNEVKEGAISEDIYKKSCEIARKYKLEDCFMGVEQQAKFVGHGIGLVLNELPVLCDKNKSVLKKGMTIAFEPKFIVKGIGAVGNENTYIVHETNVEQVTTAQEEIITL